MRTTVRRLALAVLLLAVSGCAGSLQTGGRLDPFVTVLEAWPDAYRQNFARTGTFSATAKLTIESTQFAGNVDIDIDYTRPDKLAIKGEGPLGIDVARIFIGGDRFIVYDQHNNTFTSGSVADPYLNRFQQTSFSLRDVRLAALGQAMQPVEQPRLVDRVHGLFEATDEDFRYRYLVNPRSGLLESCEVLRDGRVFMRQEFRNYRRFGEVYVPGIVQVTLLEQKERISLFFKDVRVNQPIDPQRYVIHIPTEVDQINLD